MTQAGFKKDNLNSKRQVRASLVSHFCEVFLDNARTGAHDDENVLRTLACRSSVICRQFSRQWRKPNQAKFLCRPSQTIVKVLPTYSNKE